MIDVRIFSAVAVLVLVVLCSASFVCADLIPPVISGCNVNDTALTYYQSARLNCSVVDGNTSVSWVKYRLNDVWCDATNATSDWWYYDFQCLDTTGLGYKWDAQKASDTDGNVNETSVLFNVTCDDFCGDGYCSGIETAVSCLVDCPPYCGDGYCYDGVIYARETSESCLVDCPVLDGTVVLALRYNFYQVPNTTQVIWADYTVDGIPILDGLVNITVEAASVVMDWNLTENAYGVYFTPDEIRDYLFLVVANHTLYDNKSVTGLIKSKPSFTVCVRLWEEMNMTTSYKNEFAYIFAYDPDLRCVINPKEYIYPYNLLLASGEVCWFRGEYVDGTACVELFEPNVVYRLRIVSGILNFDDSFSKPIIGTPYLQRFGQVNTELGTMKLAYSETLDILVSPWRLSAFASITGIVLALVSFLFSCLVFTITYYVTKNIWFSLAVSGLLGLFAASLAGVPMGFLPLID